MSKRLRNLAVLAALASRLAGRGASIKTFIALLVLLGLYVAVLRPAAERLLGVELPDPIPAEQPDAAPRPDAPRNDPPADALPPTAASDWLPTDLDRAGHRDYRSPAGLRYTPGSQHGHRLRHVMAHTRDLPQRDGQHGVFDASDPAVVFGLIDQAYENALAGRDVRVRREEERTVYKVDLGRRIGYIGGRVGAAKGHPPARHVRLVTEGDRLITAYPVRP